MRAELRTPPSRPGRWASRSPTPPRTPTVRASRWPADGRRRTSSSPCARRPAAPGTTLEGIVPGSRSLDQFADDEIELLGRMSAAANRPMNWNVLTVDAREPTVCTSQRQRSTAGRIGGRVVALTMPVRSSSRSAGCGGPGWQAVLGVAEQRVDRLRGPRYPACACSNCRSRLGATTSSATPTRRPTRASSRVALADIASERGQRQLRTLLDIVTADEADPVSWPTPQDDDEESWRTRGPAAEFPARRIRHDSSSSSCGVGHSTVRSRRRSTMSSRVPK